MEKNPNNDDWMRRLLTTKEIADRVGIGPRTISNWRQNLGFPYYKISRTYLHDPVEVAEWIRKNRR